MPRSDASYPHEPRLTSGLRLLLRLARRIKMPIAGYLLLTAAATGAQALLVVLAGTLVPGRDATVTGGLVDIGGAQSWVPASLFAIVAVIGIGGDFMADRVLITARRDIAPTFFTIVAQALMAHPSRATLLVGKESVAACTKLLLGGMPLGMALRLALVGMVAAARAVLLLGIAFRLAAVPLWLGSIAIALIAFPLVVGSSRRIARLEGARPASQASARRAVGRATTVLASSAEQAILPIEVDGQDSRRKTAGDTEVEAVASAVQFVTAAADSSTRRLLIAAQANFRLEATALAGFALAVALAVWSGIGVGSISSFADAAPLALALLLGLRAAGSFLRSLVRLAGMSRTFLIRSEMLALIEHQEDVWAARQQLCLLADRLGAGGAAGDDEDSGP